MKIAKEARIIIIEGITGSGKSTLQKNIRINFKDKKIYTFTEEELLLSWKHIHIPRISLLRMALFNKLLDYIENKLSNDKNLVFILDRFHISVKLLEWENDKNFEKSYSDLILRIKRLPVQIMIPILKDSQIKERAVHKERGIQWSDYLKEKLNLRGSSSLTSLLVKEQKNILKIANEQGIPYSIFDN